MPTRQPNSFRARSRVPAGMSSNRCARATQPGPDSQSKTSLSRPLQTKVVEMKITSLRPWLIKADASCWGEYLFVEVTTDEGVSGGGEITTTTRLANRALATI